MRSPNNEKKRVRATAAQLAKYGPNQRRNLFDYAPVLRRLQYICDFVFNSDKHSMALAIGICYRQLERILSGHTRLTIPVACQVVARLGISAEWLLVGSGPMLPTDDAANYFAYLPRLQTTYRTFNTLDAIAVYPNACDIQDTSPAATLSQLPFESLSCSDTFVAVAQAMFSARICQKPVCFFLDADFLSRDVVDTWHGFFRQAHANMLVMTQAGMFADAAYLNNAPIDVNAFALLAAQSGRGYAETFCAHVLSGENTETRKASLLLHASDLGCPVFIAAEVGEIAAHTNPSVRVPELGAAIGAAAYIDLLGFTEQLQRFFGAQGGVFIAAADILRSARWLLARLESLPSTAPREFTFVCFAEQTQLDACTCNVLRRLSQHGIVVRILPQFNAQTFSHLFSSCQITYMGHNYGQG